MNPTPLPLTTLRIQVFNDNAPVDATYEVDAEQALAGFTAHLTDVFGDGQRRLLRQRAVHQYLHSTDGTPTRRADAADRLRRRQPPDRRHRQVDRRLHQRRATARS